MFCGTLGALQSLRCNMVKVDYMLLWYMNIVVKWHHAIGYSHHGGVKVVFFTCSDLQTCTNLVSIYYIYFHTIQLFSKLWNEPTVFPKTHKYFSLLHSTHCAFIPNTLKRLFILSIRVLLGWNPQKSWPHILLTVVTDLLCVELSV